MSFFLNKIPVLNKIIKLPVAPHLPGGRVTPEILRRIADLAEAGNHRLKILGGSLMLLDVPTSDADQVLKSIGCEGESFIAPCVRGVQFCPGKGDCPRGLQTSSELGLELDRLFFGRQTPGKVRISVSGCPNCCAESFVRDIGFFGLAKGYTLVVGGSSGRQAAIAREVAIGLSFTEAVALTAAILDYYCSNAKPKERLGKTIERNGWNEFKTQLSNLRSKQEG